MVGIVGQILGDARVNIAGMQVSRREVGGEALMVLTIDGAGHFPWVDEPAAFAAAVRDFLAGR